jgi:uncharacterized protein YceK
MRALVIILLLCSLSGCMQVHKVTGFRSFDGVKYYPTKKGLVTKEQRKSMRKQRKQDQLNCVYVKEHKKAIKKSKKRRR